MNISPNVSWPSEDERIRQLKRPIIIGIVGHARSGKDTLTDMMMTVLKNKHKQTSVKRAFADPIREIGKLFGYTEKMMTDQELKTVPHRFWDIPFRKFAQMVGTEMFRNIWRQDVWVKMFEQRLASTDNFVFVTDVRFINEAKAVSDMGGIVIKVTKPDVQEEYERQQVLFSKYAWLRYIPGCKKFVDSKRGVYNHPSETEVELIPADIVVDNDSDLDGLRIVAARLCEELSGTHVILRDYQASSERYERTQKHH